MTSVPNFKDNADRVGEVPRRREHAKTYRRRLLFKLGYTEDQINSLSTPEQQEIAREARMPSDHYYSRREAEGDVADFVRSYLLNHGEVR